MEIEFDQAKRDVTLRERGLDFARAEEIFAGINVTMDDTRYDYGERRLITVGLLDGRTVILVWTLRPEGKWTKQSGEVRRIISMRYANERETKKYTHQMG